MFHGVGVEVGVNRGDFSQIILNTSNPTQLYLVDCWEYHPGINKDYDRDAAYQFVQDRFRENPKVHIVKAYSTAAAQQFTDEFFDFVYLDADHSYEAVTADLEAWWCKVKPGGTLAGHDYFTGKNIDVERAVNKWLKGRRLRAITSEKCPSWAIKKKTGHQK